MFTESSMCFAIRRGVGLHLNVVDSRGAQKPSSFPFGMIGFSKPVLLAPWKGQRLVLCVYLGMRYVTGGGVLVFPVNPDSFGKSGGYPWTFFSDSRRGSI